VLSPPGTSGESFAAGICSAASTTARHHYRVFRPEEILNRRTIGRLNGAKSKVKSKAETVAPFHKRTGSMGIIHADVARIDRQWRRNIGAINWNLSGADSWTRWHAVEGNGVELEACPA